MKRPLIVIPYKGGLSKPEGLSFAHVVCSASCLITLLLALGAIFCSALVVQCVGSALVVQWRIGGAGGRPVEGGRAGVRQRGPERGRNSDPLRHWYIIVGYLLFASISVLFNLYKIHV